MPAKDLPPYIRWEFETNERLREAHFLDFPAFHRHRSVPLVMCRDLYESGETTGLYRHIDFLSLYAVRNGRGIHRIESHAYSVVRGDVYLMAAGASHSLSQFHMLEVDVFYFQNTIFHAEELAALRQSPGIWQLFAGDSVMEPRIHTTPEEWRTVEAQIELLRCEWGEDTPAGSILLKHEFFRLLVMLARLLENRTLIQAPFQDSRLQDTGLAEALRYCEENFDKPLSVPLLASRSFLSRGHFTELFTREVGLSPAAYIRRIRLEKARTLLRDTNLRIAQIAVRCGFKNAAQFSRTFRAAYEISPLQFRKKTP
jgi:AraC-like DNA-binding protein/mannose-6-phosphate isomerase-like protein (cupin superfamily)